MKYLIHICLLVVLLSSCTSPEDQPAEPVSLSDVLGSATWIDLSYTFDSTTIYWPTEDGFKLNIASAGHTEGGYYYAANSFVSAEHGGTHLDAPVHFSEGKYTSDQIPLGQLHGPGIRIDVSSKALSDADYQVSVEDITNWEAENGELPKGAMLLFHTGYGKFWPDRSQYMGTELRGAEGVRQLHFPGISPEAARWLVENRNVNAVGIDTPSIDYGQSTLFETHQILFEKNIPAFENVANTSELQAKGFYVIALPMKIGGGSGGPLRIVALK